MHLIDREEIGRLPARKRKFYAVLLGMLSLVPIFFACRIGSLIWEDAGESRLFLPLAILLIPGLIVLYAGWLMWPRAGSSLEGQSVEEENPKVTRAAVLWGVLLALAIVGWPMSAQVWPESLAGRAFNAISVEVWRTLSLVAVVVAIIHRIGKQRRMGKKRDA